MRKPYGRKIVTAALIMGLIVGTLTGCGKAQTEAKYDLPTSPENSSVYVEPVENLSTDFIRGMDISSLLAEEASGVKYYDENGQEADALELFARAGVNYARVRVWNDPYDAQGNGYGGGNCDAKTAGTIGARAAQQGMKLLVDFHYSDFWADPNKQMCPKDWEGMDIDAKADALYDYTMESLKTIHKAGADIGMVQIGNEINNGMSGETDLDNRMKLLQAGSKAVRDFSKKYNKDIQIAVHFTNVDDASGLYKKVTWLDQGGLDYDIFGVSYYSYWHGSLENLTYVLGVIRATYGKTVCVLETSFPYTGADGDASGNSISEGDITGDYVASVQSQATAVRDVIAAANAAGAVGVFYWEGAWIPVGSDYTTNSVTWAKYGSGWASQYAADYDPNDAGKYYGGSSWDNQAFFDFKGNVLPSINVFKYVYSGTVTEPAIDFLKETEVTISIGDELVMPEGVWAVYNNRALSQTISATWNETQVAAIDTSVGGDYVVNGELDDGTKVDCKVKVAFINWLENPSFEDMVTGMWKVTGDTSSATDIQTKAADAVTGENAFHWWKSSEQSFQVQQTVSGLAAGTYNATVNIQGGDVGDAAEIYLFVTVGDTTYTSDPVTLTGWVDWKQPEVKGVQLKDGEDITVGVSVKCAGGGWGTMDDFLLYRE